MATNRDWREYIRKKNAGDKNPTSHIPKPIKLPLGSVHGDDERASTGNYNYTCCFYSPTSEQYDCFITNDPESNFCDSLGGTIFGPEPPGGSCGICTNGACCEPDGICTDSYQGGCGPSTVFYSGESCSELPCPVNNFPTWTKLSYTNPSGSNRSGFGCSLSMTPDHQRLIVGQTHPETGYAQAPGAANIFKYNSEFNRWTEEAVLLPSDGVASDRFGSNVQIHGDIAIVSHSWLSGTRGGKVWVFKLTENGWTEIQKITDPEQISISFGSSIAFDGSTLVVGDPLRPANIPCVHVYRFNRSESLFEYEYKIDSGEPNSWFGEAVALSGNRLIVGAGRAVINPVIGEQGAVYVYTRTPVNNRWERYVRLHCPNSIDNPSGDPNGWGTLNDFFGSELDISGNTIVVGSHPRGTSYEVGRMWIWRYRNRKWVMDINDLGYGNWTRFGRQVSVGSDGTVAAGLPRDELFVGRVLFYTPTGKLGVTPFTRQSISNPEPHPYRYDVNPVCHGDEFGTHIAISDRQIIVGAPGGTDCCETSGYDCHQGEVYVFNRPTEPETFRRRR